MMTGHLVVAGKKKCGWTGAWRNLGSNRSLGGSAPRELFAHSHKPIRSLDDYKGMKVRTAGAWAEIAQKLGASTVILAGAEVYPALERKVVDAIEWEHQPITL